MQKDNRLDEIYAVRRIPIGEYFGIVYILGRKGNTLYHDVISGPSDNPGIPVYVDCTITDFKRRRKGLIELLSGYRLHFTDDGKERRNKTLSFFDKVAEYRSENLEELETLLFKIHAYEKTIDEVSSMLNTRLKKVPVDDKNNYIHGFTLRSLKLQALNLGADAIAGYESLNTDFDPIKRGIPVKMVKVER